LPLLKFQPSYLYFLNTVTQKSFLSPSILEPAQSHSMQLKTQLLRTYSEHRYRHQAAKFKLLVTRS